VTASQKDRDYIAAVDWRMAEKLAGEGKGDLIGGIKVLNPKDFPVSSTSSLRQVAARRGRGARRQVRHRVGQAPGRDDGVQLGEGPDRDEEQDSRATRTASRC